jgi:hypothetical protein
MVYQSDMASHTIDILADDFLAHLKEDEWANKE